MSGFTIVDDRGGEGAIHVEGYEKSTADSLRDIAQALAKSYRERPKGQPIGEWLTGQLAGRLAGHMDSQSIQQMSDGILKSVQTFNAHMADLQQKKRTGMTQEAWLEEEMVRNAPGATEEEKKENLLRFQAELQANDQMAQQAETSEAVTLHLEQAGQQGQELYEEQQGKGSTLREIAKATSLLAGAAGMANLVMGDRIGELAEALDGLDDSISFLSELEPGEEMDTLVKTIAATALDIGISEGEIPFFPAEMPVPLEAVEALASSGVETLKSIASFAADAMDGEEAMDHIADATAVLSSIAIKTAVGAGLLWAARTLAAPVGTLLSLPPVRGVVKELAEPVAEKAANVVRDAIQKLKPWAVPRLLTAREKIAAVGQTAKQAATNFVHNFFD